jgi:hypothetical protein
MTKINLTKIDDSTYQVSANGCEVGKVFAQTFEGSERVMWNFEGNPFPRALFPRPYDAARKMVDRANRVSTLEQMNGKPLAVRAS